MCGIWFDSLVGIWMKMGVGRVVDDNIFVYLLGYFNGCLLCVIWNDIGILFMDGGG